MNTEDFDFADLEMQMRQFIDEVDELLYDPLFGKNPELSKKIKDELKVDWSRENNRYLLQRLQNTSLYNIVMFVQSNIDTYTDKQSLEIIDHFIYSHLLYLIDCISKQAEGCKMDPTRLAQSRFKFENALINIETYINSLPKTKRISALPKTKSIIPEALKSFEKAINRQSGGAKGKRKSKRKIKRKTKRKTKRKRRNSKRKTKRKSRNSKRRTKRKSRNSKKRCSQCGKLI